MRQTEKVRKKWQLVERKAILGWRDKNWNSEPSQKAYFEGSIYWREVY